MPKLPKFKTEEEFAEFVDTHDIAPYWNQMTPVDASKFRLKRRRQTAVRVLMSQAELRKLKALAAQRKINPEILLHEWLAQRIKQEQART